jgi:hypothetical protein
VIPTQTAAARNRVTCKTDERSRLLANNKGATIPPFYKMSASAASTLAGIPSYSSSLSASLANSVALKSASKWPSPLPLDPPTLSIGPGLATIPVPTPRLGTGCGNVRSALGASSTGSNEPWYGCGWDCEWTGLPTEERVLSL